MKKHLFLGFLGAMALASCSNDEPINNSGADNGNGDGSTHYLSVNIVSTPASTPVSKAGGNQETGDPDGATYEEGFANENAVQKVRFYFFDGNGNAVNVRNTPNGVNYYDWANPADSGQDMPNVEKQLEATLVIHTGTPDNHGLPEQMVAIVNPDEKIGNDAMSLTDLRAIVNDYVATAKNSTEKAGSFVMINSVYKNGSSEIIANQVPQSYYQTSEELAKKNPINIYVERNVAKVRVKVDSSKFGDDFQTNVGSDGDMNPGFNAIKAKDKDGNYIKTPDGKQILIRFPGWNVTAETNMGYLSKHINTSWENKLFGAEQWNWSPYFRSYWAINPTDSEFAQAWHSFNDIINNGGKKFGSTNNSNVIYLNENAPQYAASKSTTGKDLEQFTKVVLSGQLVGEDGEPIELGKYAGITVVGESKLQEAMLDQLKQNGMIYMHWTEEGEKKVASLDMDDICFKTATDIIGEEIETEKETGRYYVYIQLSSSVKQDVTWNFSADPKNDAADKNLADAAAINKYLKNQLGYAMLWKTGLTYFYFPIQHLGEEGKIGYYGVVRNHIYDCVIEAITGLGTPVYDPTEDVYPEKPKEEDTFIGAQINILSWRVVPNHVELDW